MTEPARLYVAFLWHMHQPFYKDFGTNKYILPWVRLHAIKDYYDMIFILDKFPQVQMTFNLVPSLLVQLEDLASGRATDTFWDLTLIPAGQLDQEAKNLIIKNFFYINWDNLIRIYPRYEELLDLRGKFVTDAELEKISDRFSEQDFLDLQVWFNLAWFGQLPKTTDPLLIELIKKGRHFSEEDKHELLAKQLEIMRAVVPKYKELMSRGQIEISTTPFYHPILPVLLNARSARETTPDVRLPDETISWPEDVRAQLYLAVTNFKENFGQEPKGMWPSEGSVSDELVPYLMEQNLKWVATDEEILALSLGRTYSGPAGRPISAQELYRPFKIVKNEKELALFFRDHNLSDMIGFLYSKWKPQDATEDFINHLRRIREALPAGKGFVVSVILDGENAWEYYQNNGIDFLSSLYEKLSGEPDIKTTTFSNYLNLFPVFQKLDRLAAGSWINHNFRIWIGDDEDNTAWEYLARARSMLQEIAAAADPKDTETQKRLAAAWQEIFIAEGSDWYWWYGDDHSSAHDHEFDALFRRHLTNIYHILNLPVPDYLIVAIKGAFKPTRTSREPTFTIKPIIDGRVTSYYEWLAAGQYSAGGGRGAMHQSQTVVKEIFYGFDMQNLYFRVDFNESLKSECEHKDITFSFRIFNSEEFKVNVGCTEARPKPFMELYKKNSRGQWQKEEELTSFAVAEIIEMALPFDKIGARRGEKLKFMLVMERDGHELGKWPAGGFITVEVPKEDYEADMWCA